MIKEFSSEWQNNVVHSSRRWWCWLRRMGFWEENSFNSILLPVMSWWWRILILTLGGEDTIVLFWLQYSLLRKKGEYSGIYSPSLQILTDSIDLSLRNYVILANCCSRPSVVQSSLRLFDHFRRKSVSLRVSLPFLKKYYSSDSLVLGQSRI